MIALMAVLGAVSGYLALLLSRRLIKSRMGEIPASNLVAGRPAPYVWCLISSAGYAIIGLAAGRTPTADVTPAMAGAECAAVFTICLCIGAVDWVSKKIPNPLLLALIINKAAFLALLRDSDAIKKSLVGFAVASVIFAIPSLLKISVGAGDVKLAAVSGLYLGVGGFLQAMIIMAVLITIYGVYLKIRKLGGFRTKTAMGPYLAFGLICTLVFPVVL